MIKSIKRKKRRGKLEKWKRRKEKNKKVSTGMPLFVSPSMDREIVGLDARFLSGSAVQTIWEQYEKIAP